VIVPELGCAEAQRFLGDLRVEIGDGGERSPAAGAGDCPGLRTGFATTAFK
jgi:hypothetical protein